MSSTKRYFSHTMAHTYRFFVPPDQFTSDSIVLSSEESHHAIHVARLRTGQQVEAFDGAGGVAVCQLREVTKRSAVLEVLRLDRVAAPRRRLILAVASPNRERAMERIVESCVPLGVTEFRVMGSEHSERHPTVSPKWDRWAREACKQCFRPWMPTFSVSMSLVETLQESTDPVILLAPDAPTAQLPRKLEAADACTCLVGPEGGFSEREAALAVENGAIPVSLGEHILRTELACSTISALVMYQWRSAGTGS